jgi:exopolysaccharide biosynthesis WecB/TagA/CpsF family protein
MREPKFEQILGVRFFNGSVKEALEYISGKGGYTVVPAAPALANIQRDPDYRRALIESNLAIADSGFMTLLWRIIRGRKVMRISGLQYLQMLFSDAGLHERGRLFLVLPSEIARQKALRLLQAQGFQIGEANTYIAPIYGFDVIDEHLVSALKASRPDHVIIGIGGGAKEKLGLYLREHLGYRPTIHCIGAALGFLSGDQKPIPMWADRFYLGWFLRLSRQPMLLGRRFLRAFELPGLIWRYGKNLPPLRKSKVEM